MPLGRGVPESRPQQGQHGLGAGAAGRRGMECPGQRVPGLSEASPPLPIRGPRCRLGLGSGPCTVTNKHRAVDNWPQRPCLSPEPDIPAAALASLPELLRGQSRLACPRRAPPGAETTRPQPPSPPCVGMRRAPTARRKQECTPGNAGVSPACRPPAPGPPVSAASMTITCPINKSRGGGTGSLTSDE